MLKIRNILPQKPLKLNLHSTSVRTKHHFSKQITDINKRNQKFVFPKYNRLFSAHLPPIQPDTPTESTNTALSTTPETGVVFSGLDGVLNHKVLVVTRDIEWGNVIFGFEQANKYSLKNQDGQVVGYMAEDSGGMSVVTRQLMRTHRPFKATIFDTAGNIVLQISRPAYLVSSSLYVSLPDGQQIGEVHMQWHLLRRKYNLVYRDQQFAHIDAAFLNWDFHLLDEQGRELGAINKDWTGLGRELFTDGNQYLLHFEKNQIDASVAALVPNDEAARSLSLHERAIMLATAVSVDFDYFSRRSGHSFMPGFFFPPVPIPPHETGTDSTATTEGATTGATTAATTASSDSVDSPAATTSPTGESIMQDSSSSWQTGPSTTNDYYGNENDNAPPQEENGGDYWQYDENDSGGGSEEGGGLWGTISGFFDDD